jgi:hypothetical protein
MSKDNSSHNDNRRVVRLGIVLELLSAFATLAKKSSVVTIRHLYERVDPRSFSLQLHPHFEGHISLLNGEQHRQSFV